MQDRNELIINVKPGTKVRVVETSARDSDRDLEVSIPAELKVAVKRVPNDGKIAHLASTITMCG